MIKTPMLSKYDNTQFCAFFLSVLKVLENHNDINLTAHLLPLENTVKALSRGQSIERDNLITAAIKAADTRRDHAFLGIKKTVEGHLTHFETEKRDAAKLLSRNFKKFGNITRLPYNNASSSFNSLLRDWQTPDLTAALAVLGLSQWREELKAAQAQFADLYLDRIESESLKTAPPITKLRPDAVRVYHNLATLLTAFAQITPHVYEPMINELNQIIQEANRQVKMNKTRRAKDSAV